MYVTKNYFGWSSACLLYRKVKNSNLHLEADFFGYAYPAYEFFKTVEKNKPETEQLLFWCQYWYASSYCASILG